MAETDNLPQQPPIGSIDPRISMLLSMGGGNQSGVTPAVSPMGALPPTNPVQPAAGGADIASLVRQVAQLPQYQQASQRLDQIGSQEQDIQKQIQGMPVPKTGPQIQPGAGFLHNLGQALLMMANITRPGQQLNQTIYGPGIRQYGAQQKALAEQLAALKDQEAIPTEELRATTGLTQAAGLANYRGSMAESRQVTAQAAKERADAYVQSIKDRAANMVKTWDLKSAAQDERKRHDLVDEAQAVANEAGRNYREEHRDATTEDVAQVVSGTRQQIANEAAARDPSVKSWLFNALGIDIPQLQSAPSPEFRTTQPGSTSTPAKSPVTAPVKPPKKKGNTQEFHYDAQGNRVAGP